MICGHDRETLRWALRLDADVQAGHVTFSIGARRAGKHSRNWAYDVIHDPAKLAAIIAELLRERGIDASTKRESSARFYVFDRSSVDRIVIRDRDIADLSGPPGWFDLDMPKACEFALALLNAPNATAQNIERMIGAL